MIAKSTRYAVCLGLAGSVAVAVAPAVRAQVQVTGGGFQGQAAFFVPTPGTGTGSAGQVELFDLGVQRLQLQTSVGNTSTATFVPTAARFNAGSDNQPNANDTGTVRGLLSGIAFSGSGGTPIPFTNRDTLLNFSVNSFSSNLGRINGTLLSPQTAGQASLVFLPYVNATVASGSSYQATRGNLQLGDIDASLTNGAIDLPQGIRFQNIGSSNGAAPIASLDRRVSFIFEGQNVTPETGTNLNISTGSTQTGGTQTGGTQTGGTQTGGTQTGGTQTGGTQTGGTQTGGTQTGGTQTGSTQPANSNNQLRFVGQANSRFRISTVGSGNGQYSLESNLGAVDIQINGPYNATTTGTLSNNQRLDRYSIQGESNGVLSLFALNSVGFGSTSQQTSGSTSQQTSGSTSQQASSTRFDFQQGSNRLQGTSSGDVSFYAVAGVSSFNRDTAFNNYNYQNPNPNSSSGSNPSQTCNTCGTTLGNNSSVAIGGSSFTVGSPIYVNVINGSGSGSNNTSGSGTATGNTGTTGSGNTSGGGGTSGSGNASGGGGTSGSGNASGSGGTSGGNTTSASGNSFNTDQLGQSGTSSQEQYQILVSSNVRVISDINNLLSSLNQSDNNVGRVRVRVVRRGTDVYYVVYVDRNQGRGSNSGGNQQGQGNNSGGTSGQGQGTGTGTASGGTSGQGQGTGTGTASGGTSGQGQGQGTGTASGGTSGTGTGSTTASGNNQGQQGSSTTASGDNDDDDNGASTTASGNNQGQQGSSTTASGNNQGQQGSSTASGNNQGQQGSSTTASGDNDDDDNGASTTASNNGQNQGSSEAVQVVYQEVGPPCRLVPGLVGLRQLSANEAASIGNSNNTNTSTNNNNNTTPSGNSGSTTPSQQGTGGTGTGTTTPSGSTTPSQQGTGGTGTGTTP